MTLVTVHAVVYVSVDALVIPIDLILIGVLMATQTREN